MGTIAFPVDPALRPWVESLHAYDLAGFEPGVHIGLPSAHAVLVLPTEPALDLTMGGRRQLMTSCLSGLHDGPVAIRHNGTQRGIQVSLTPLGLASLFGVPAGALAHDAVELADVLGPDAERWTAQIADAPTWPVRLAVVQQALIDLLSARDRPHPVRPEVLRAWSLIESSQGRVRIGAVAVDVGWSARHLTEQFRAATGLAPKAVARIVRFQRSVALVAGRTGLAESAARAGYADQAHLTREWTRLAGTTPGRWPEQDVLANVQDKSPGVRRGSTP